MSSRDAARRTDAQFVFAGVDITSSITPYLLSATYTDNEEDETDDLQIKLQDREGVWLTKWLNDAVQAAASTGAPELASGSVSDSGTTHTVVKGDTLGEISAKYLGSSSRYMEIYELNSDIIKNPNLIYPGQVLKIPGGGEASAAESIKTSLKIQAVFVRKNWKGGGKDAVLDCGVFELDSIDASGPPATVTIKATSLPYSAQIRQTEKSRAWEAYTLSGIAQEIAAANGMTCMYESSIDPAYERLEQYKVSDIAFLSSLCHDAGISLKATNNIIVLFDQASYEAKSAVATIKKGASGGYTKYKLSTGAADTEYSSCRVSYTDPTTGKSIEAVAKVEDYKADAKNNQQLEVTAKVASIAEAKALAEKRLRLHNKYSQTASFTMPGDPSLVAGVTVTLEGWGAWNGKYIVNQAKHSVDNGGYTTQIKLRRILEGY